MTAEHDEDLRPDDFHCSSGLLWRSYKGKDEQLLTVDPSVAFGYGGEQVMDPRLAP